MQGSQLLGSEARVSSDERVLWPQRSAALYRQSGAVTLAAGLAHEQRQSLGLEPLQVFERGGARIAVVGVTDPYAQDQKGSLKQWYQSLLPTFEQARREADLVVAMADVGTGPGLWLAERLVEADVLLCARGQDLWPVPVQATQASGRRVPVLFAGCRGSGAFRLRCQQVAGLWQFDGQFFPAFARYLSPAAQMRASQLQGELREQRPAMRRGSTSHWRVRPRPCGGGIPVAVAGTACCTRPWPMTAACRCCCRACATTTPWRQARRSPAST